MAFQNRAAFGNIYTIPTSTVDNIAKMVYQEQKQREQQKLQQDKALDDEFAKNVAGVKSADIPEITSAYNEFKQAHINLQKKGQKATPQDQMDVMLKKAAVFQAINASKEDKERLKQYAATVKSDTKGIYDPNAPQMVNTWLNTPTSKRNFDEDANLKYKYVMPNIDKEIKNAAGIGKDFELQVGVDEKDPLKDKVEVYRTINPPNVFYNNLFTGLASRSDNKGFTRSVTDNMTDEEKEKLRVAYEAKIQDPKFKALYGDVQPFPASAANTELGQAVALKTMEAFVNLPIEKVKDKSVTNLDRANKEKRNYSEGEFDRRQRIRTRDSLIKIAANKPGGSGVETSGNSYDEIGGVEDLVNDKITISQGMVTDNKTNMPYTGTTPFKREYLPANVTTALAAGKISIPREVTVVVKDGKIEAIRTSNGEISRQAIENLQKKVNTEPVKGAQPVYGNPKTKQVEQKPKTEYSRADLKSGGWTDEQIDKAVKAGKIKLN